jgi:uncharacterized peroxidase-related enzyme
MANMKPVNPPEATGKVKQLFDVLQQKLGMVPNLAKMLANSPAALNAYLSFSGALSEGMLSAKTREQIAVAVANVNTCDYCLSAHNALGKLAGLNADDLSLAQKAEARDQKTAAALRFAVKAVRERGLLPVSEIESLRAAGHSDGEIVEIIAAVALNIFTNYFNHLAATDIDFPIVRSVAR